MEFQCLGFKGLGGQSIGQFGGQATNPRPFKEEWGGGVSKAWSRSVALALIRP